MRALIVVAAVLALAACGERSQEARGERSYQGKPDMNAWDNAPPAAELRGGQWTKGDRASWQEQLRNRQLAQHEDRRIYR
jgi:hypothetical protein